MRRSAEVKVGQPQSAVHSAVLSLPIYPLTASRSVSGSTLLHVITQAADNRHFIRTRARRCSSCPCTSLTLCDRMPMEAALLEVSDLSYETRRLRRCSPLSLQHYFFTVTLISIQTCLQLTGWGLCLPLLYRISKKYLFLKLHWNLTHIFFLYLYLI